MSDFFELKKNHTTIRTEIIAGFTSFLAMMYIIIVNPSILSHAGITAIELSHKIAKTRAFSFFFEN